MSQLTNIPLQDNYKSTLSQAWDGNVWTIYVNTTPSFTFPSWVKTYICVDPWKTNMQVARISAYDATLKTITVDSITVDKGNGVAYTAQTHTVGSAIEISDNYQFRKDIQTAINTKVNTNSTDTDIGKFADATARDAYFTSPVNGNTAYLTTEGKRTDYVGGAWVDRATGSVSNASTTVAGKVEMATQAETEAGTTTGWTGALLTPTPATINPNNITSATPATWDKLSFADISASNALKSTTISNMLSLLSSAFYWSWSDWDVTISWTVTLSRDMYYNNLTIPSSQTLNTAWYRVFVKWTISWTGTINRNGNAWWNASWTTAWTAATTLNQWSLNWEVASGAGWAWNAAWFAWTAWVNGTASNPSMVNVNWVAGWAGGAAWWGWGWWWAWWSAWASTRWANYLNIFPFFLIHPATWWSLTLEAYKSIASSGGWWWGGSVAPWSNGGWWGWWWGNGWFIRIACYIWNFTWSITATWWAWGNWANATWWQAGWGWGGWGGNGWTLLRFYWSLIADAAITLTWWTWWAAWTWIGAWSTNGTVWATWATGTTISIVI